jgi:hypothetical protein
MEKYILIVLLFWFHVSFGQSNDSVYYVKEFGWSIHLPPGFQVIDTATLHAESRSRESQIHWINKPQSTDTNWAKTVFWARDTHLHVISLHVIDSTHERLDSNFTENKFKFYGKFRISTEVFDGIKFYELMVKMNTSPSYVSVTLKTLQHGKIYRIDYVYDDTILEDEIETMLKTSTFDK